MTEGLPTNEKLIRDFLRDGEYAEQTERVRRLQLQKLAAAIAPAPLAAATEDDMYRWRRTLSGAPETIASYVSAASVFYAWMSTTARPRLRIDDPSAILRRPRIPERPPRPMVDRHYDLALACALSDPLIYTWLGLMGCCGLRCCEVAWMRGSDVEELPDGRGLLHVLGKGNKRRTVPAGHALMLSLRPFRLASRGPMFTRPSDGGPHSPKRVSQIVTAFLRSVGVPEQPHQLRHRFGTDYHAIDRDVFRQAKLMGHASVDTTLQYSEVSPLEAVEYVDQLTNRRLRPRPHTSHGRVA